MMKQDDQISISVRDLVEFVMSSGDIDNRRTAGAKKEAMQEGSRLHRKIQKRMGSSYQAEVAMRHVVQEEQFQILVEGRADGVITENGGSVIDEIKCMYGTIDKLEEPIPVHLAQAMCYGYFWCLKKELASIGIQITYCQMETEEIRRFRQEKSFEELEVWFTGLIHEYVKWAEYLHRHHVRRQESLKELEFPYPYRKGQKELAVNVYRSIARGRNLYIQAPTGIGKTLSTVYPALKAIGEGHGDKLFYLTAKNMTRRVAEEGLSILREKGLYFSSVTITAKEKLCFLETPECNPEACPYAKGHFDRVNDAVFDIIHQEFAITRDRVTEYAMRYQICPFEFCLDISNWVDGVICDYNYVFDPNVRLKRYFAEERKGGYLFLIDEAHNLVSRAREMYSAVLVKEDILLAKRLVKGHSRKLEKLLESCNKSMLELKRECENYMILEDVNHLAVQVMGMSAELDVFMEDHPELENRELLLDFYFQVRDFLNVFQWMDDGYEIYSQMLPEGTFQVKLFCINPSGRLRACMDQGLSTILFSATMLPMPYYKELLSGEPEGFAVYAESPFLQEKRLLLVAEDVSSRYSRRNLREYQKAAAYVQKIVKGKVGNYMVFCPSYQYLGELAECLEEAGFHTESHWRSGKKVVPEMAAESDSGSEEAVDSKTGAEFDLGAEVEADVEAEKRPCAPPETGRVRMIVQESRMNEQEREDFLNQFTKRNQTELEDASGEDEGQTSLVALCVMGGVFGEGIDLKEEGLIGVIVIGTGLPMVCPEQDILKGYFERHEKPGFAYAYQYPGMNKVMQAAGRVIRTMKDEGVIALLDDRFLQPDYQALFPREWSDYQVTRLNQVGEQVRWFWQGRES